MRCWTAVHLANAGKLLVDLGADLGLQGCGAELRNASQCVSRVARVIDWIASVRPGEV